MFFVLITLFVALVLFLMVAVIVCHLAAQFDREMTNISFIIIGILSIIFSLCYTNILITSDRQIEFNYVNSANHNEYAYTSYNKNTEQEITLKNDEYMTTLKNDEYMTTFNLDDVTIIQDLGQGASPIINIEPVKEYDIFGITIYATLDKKVTLHISDESQISKTPFTDWVDKRTLEEINLDIKKRSDTNN